MKKIFIILSLFLFNSRLAAGGFDQCPDMISNDIPQANVQGSVQLCRKAYIVNYDLKYKAPIYVAYDLTPDHAVGCLKRTNKFKEDPDIESASPDDYKDSGFDRGHMAPDADFEWDYETEHQSFYMTNMSPQLPELNRHSWEKLEVTIRAWVISRNESLTIYTGTVYNDQSKRLKNNVIIPDAFFKVVVFNKSKFALAFLYPQSNEIDLNINDFQVSIDEVENKTNLKFILPYDKKIKSNIPDIGTGIVTKSKHNACKQ